jgi:glycosyltransferase involved in cell wall biosynthesis
MGKDKELKTGLSIIIPFVGEYPQVLFTIQSTAQTLLSMKLDFEIIAVDNWCEKVAEQQQNALIRTIHKCPQKPIQGEKTDAAAARWIKEVNSHLFPIYDVSQNRSGAAISASAGKNPWLKYIPYGERLSHWQAKRVGVEHSTYDTLLFMDAHTVPAPTLFDMFMNYRFGKTSDELSFFFDSGTMHMPLTYKILEWHRLIYKLVIEGEKRHFWTYSFTPLRPSNYPYEVPCMSTCGMMIARHIYDSIGGWPEGLGIYGGGENFMNYTLSVTGYKKWIYPNTTLFHHGEKRDYHYEYDDMLYNRMTSHYLFGGLRLLDLFTKYSKGRPAVLSSLRQKCIEQHKQHREKIKRIQVCDIEEWVARWEDKIGS